MAETEDKPLTEAEVVRVQPGPGPAAAAAAPSRGSPDPAPRPPCSPLPAAVERGREGESSCPAVGAPAFNCPLLVLVQLLLLVHRLPPLC